MRFETNCKWNVALTQFFFTVFDFLKTIWINFEIKIFLIEVSTLIHNWLSNRTIEQWWKFISKVMSEKFGHKRFKLCIDTLLKIRDCRLKNPRTALSNRFFQFSNENRAPGFSQKRKWKKLSVTRGERPTT